MSEITLKRQKQIYELFRELFACDANSEQFRRLLAQLEEWLDPIVRPQVRGVVKGQRMAEHLVFDGCQRAFGRIYRMHPHYRCTPCKKLPWKNPSHCLRYIRQLAKNAGRYVCRKERRHKTVEWKKPVLEEHSLDEALLMRETLETVLRIVRAQPSERDAETFLRVYGEGWSLRKAQSVFGYSHPEEVRRVVSRIRDAVLEEFSDEI